MTLKQLFFSFNGRIPRSDLWAGSFGLTLAAVVLVALLFPIASSLDLDLRTHISIGPIDTLLIWVPIIPILIVIYFCFFALVAKRLHDRNRSAWWLLILIIVPLLDSVVFKLWSSKPVDGVNATQIIWAVARSVIAIWFVIELALLKGTDGPNRFGPDPLAPPDPGGDT